MSKQWGAWLIGLGTIWFASDVGAQPSDEGRSEAHRPRIPLVAALDANGDGVISSEEIDGAVAALKSLDKNQDGKLERSEIRPDMGRRVAHQGADRDGGEPGRGEHGRHDRRRRGPDHGDRHHGPPPGHGHHKGRGEHGRGEHGRGEHGPGDRGPGDRGPGDRGPGDRGPDDRGPREHGRGDHDRPAGDRDGGHREHGERGGDHARGGRPMGPPGFGPPPGRGGRPTPERFLERAMQFDENNDGQLSGEELKAMAESFPGRGRPDRGGPRDGEPRGDHRPPMETAPGDDGAEN